jgi:hypothetical protein
VLSSHVEFPFSIRKKYPLDGDRGRAQDAHLWSSTPNRKIPIGLQAPGAETLAAIPEADEIPGWCRIRFSIAADLFDALEKNSAE